MLHTFSFRVLNIVILVILYSLSNNSKISAISVSGSDTCSTSSNFFFAFLCALYFLLSAGYDVLGKRKGK